MGPFFNFVTHSGFLKVTACYVMEGFVACLGPPFYLAFLRNHNKDQQTVLTVKSISLKQNTLMIQNDPLGLNKFFKQVNMYWVNKQLVSFRKR